MEIVIKARKNNSAVTHKYVTSEEPVTEAVACEEAKWFETKVALKREVLYTLLDQEGKYVAMVMYFTDDKKIVQVTFTEAEIKQGMIFQVHEVEEKERQVK